MADEQTRVTPTDAFKKQDKVDAAKYARDIRRARAEGVAEGRTLARKQVVDFLQKKYLGDDAPDRSTPEATAILQLTREVMAELTGKKL